MLDIPASYLGIRVDRAALRETGAIGMPPPPADEIIVKRRSSEMKEIVEPVTQPPAWIAYDRKVRQSLQLIWRNAQPPRRYFDSTVTSRSPCTHRPRRPGVCASVSSTSI